MPWLKHVLLDLAVTASLVAYALGARPVWLWWALALYTGLMLLLKAMAASSPAVSGLSGKAAKEVPPWFFHALYAASALALLYARWYELAAAWAVIWLLSFLAEARASAAPVSRKGKPATASARR